MCERQGKMKHLRFGNLNIVQHTKLLCHVFNKTDAVKTARRNIHSEQEGISMDIDTLNKCIHDLCTGKKLQQAKLILRLCNRVANDATYNHVIHGLCVEGNDIHEAYGFLDEMMGRGLCPSISTYNVFMRALCNSDSLHEARALLTNMMELGCIPNGETYHVLFDSLCKAKSFIEACDLVSDMVDKNIKPDSCMTQGLIKSLYRAGQTERAKQLCKKIGGIICILNPPFVRQLVKGFVREGFADEGIKFIEDVVSFGCLPDKQAFRALLVSVGVVGRMDQAKDILNKMTLVLECPPCIVTYNVLINSLCKAGYVDEACGVVCLMQKQGCAPNVVTYGSVIDGFSEKGLTDLANCIFNEMVENGCYPNVIVYTSLIKGNCKAGMLDETMSLVKKMEVHGCLPNLYTYNTLLGGLCRAGKIHEVEQLLDEMLDKGFIPDIFTYYALVDGFRTGCKGHGIQRVFDRIAKKCPNQELKTDRSLLEALAQRSM